MDREDLSKVRLFAGSVHPQLCQAISEHLGIPLSTAFVGKFSNGETRIELHQTCRGFHAYVIQPICASEDGKFSVNDGLMEVLLFTSALKRASAKTVTVVLPLYGYARQDKKEKSRASITARLVADLLEASGIDRVITVDLHSSQIEGFFSKPVDNLASQALLVNHIQARWGPLLKKNEKKNGTRSGIMVVSPDAGGTKRALQIAKQLGVATAIISKERSEASVVQRMMVVGNVAGQICILVDDLADTCGTLAMAAETLNASGAAEVHAYVVHGVFSGNAFKTLTNCRSLLSIVTTNTLPQGRIKSQFQSKIEVIDISPLLASAIQLIHTNKSLTSHL